MSGNPVLPNEIRFPTVAEGILLLLVERDRPIRTKTIIVNLRSDECSESIIYETLGALQRQGLIVRNTNQKKFTDYKITETGRNFVPNIDNTPSKFVEHIANMIVERKLLELPENKRTQVRQKSFETYKNEVERLLQKPIQSSKKLLVGEIKPESK